MYQTENISSLADMTDYGYQIVIQLVKKLINDLQDNCKESDLSLKSAINAFKSVLEQSSTQEVMMALLGEMSSGKSSLINVALGYPLFPVAKVTTSACPVEVHYGSRFKMQVFTCSQDVVYKPENEHVVFTFDSPDMLSWEQREALLEYARKCVTSKLLVCENFDYYYDIRKGNADLQNVFHCAQLLIVLLNGYVGQDYDAVSSRREELIREREELFGQVFGIPASTNIGIRIWIDSSILKPGLILADLPGLGSDAKSHNGITTNYINRAHCCVMLFGLDGNAAENRAALDLMQKYEIMKYPGKSNRFILAINKCDIPYEESEYYYDDIEQAVQSIYDTLHSIEIREIIPLSARYAEYRYVQNGIEPEKTMLGRKLMRNGEGRETVLDHLKENYNTEFCYTDYRNDVDITYSTRSFLEEEIGEYVVRIRYLNLARMLVNVFELHREAISSVNVEIKMLAVLEILGSSLMKDLMGRMNKAVKDTQTEFLDNIDEVWAELNCSRKLLHNTLVNEIIPAYEQDLTRADKDLNSHMLSEVKSMTSDWADHVCIDEKDDISKANKQIFDDLKDYFTKFDFGPYLEVGNNLLNSYLEEQRKSYKTGINKATECFQLMTSRTDEALNLAFDQFLKSKRLQEELSKDSRGAEISQEIIKTYRDCYVEAKQSISDHLCRISKKMTQDLHADEGVEKEINETISIVYTFFDTLIDVYHTHCDKYLGGRQKTTFWKNRPYLDVSTIQEEISIPFTSTDHRKIYVGGLKDALVGQTPNSHNTRLETAMDNARKNFVNGASGKINIILAIVDKNVRTLFDTGTGSIREQYVHIGRGIQHISSSLSRFDTHEKLGCIMGMTYPWAHEARNAYRKKLREAQQELREVYKKVSEYCEGLSAPQEGEDDT